MLAITRMAWYRGDPEAWMGAAQYEDREANGKNWRTTKSESVEANKGEQKGYFDFQFEKPEDVADIQWDVIIVGSGCGGGVAAKRCAEAGMKTLVVEKGGWVPNSQLPLKEDAACRELYESGLFMASDDGSVTIIAGSTFGGGSVVNWAASLQTQWYVREEWAKKHNLPFFLSDDFQRCLDTVYERMGVKADDVVEHNLRNRQLLEGARRLGYHSRVVPQNAKGVDHGYTTYGCGGEPGKRKMGV